jgi:hypothetical protein
MRAKNLIAGAAFDPATVKAMGEAFDQAWAIIAQKFAEPRRRSRSWMPPILNVGADSMNRKMRVGTDVG